MAWTPGSERTTLTDEGISCLGIDIGSSNTKVVLAQVRPGPAGGRVDEVAVAGAPTPAGAVELVGRVAELVRRVLGPTASVPLAVGVASMAETGVPLDRDGAPLTDLLRWDGHRAGAEADALARTYGRRALFGATGVRAGAKVPLATWAWLRSHHPEVFARTARWAGAADLVVLALTGELVTDHTLAGRTMAYRLPGPDGALPTTFDASLLGAVGLTPDHLPRVVAPGTVAGAAGRSDARAAASRMQGFWSDAGRVLVEAGVPRGTPVVVAGHDHAVGAWAAGVRRPGDRGDSIGTAEAVLTVLAGPPEPEPVAAAGMSWVRTVSGRHDALLAGSSSAGAMLGWLLDRSGQGTPAAADRVFADALADSTEDPAPTGVLVLPYLAGRQCPEPDPRATVRVLPDVRPGPRLTRALLEGLSLQARWMLAEQAVHSGDRAAAPDEPVVVLGGPALANPAWVRAKSAVMPGPLDWVTSAEPVATGAALLAVARAGLLSGEPPTLPRRRTAAPEDPHAYDRMYRDFVAAARGATTRGAP